MKIDLCTAAEIMSRGHDRNGFPSHVYTRVHAFLKNGGETLGHIDVAYVARVQKHVILAADLHFTENGA